jgi:hypothetical protein
MPVPLNSDGVFDLGIAVLRDSGPTQQARRLALILGHAAAFHVERRERVLRFRIAGVGRGTEQLGGTHKVLRKQLALEIKQPEITGRDRVPELCGGFEQLCGPALLARAGAAGHPKHRERKHGFAIAALAGTLVPFRRLIIVAPDAKSVGVKFTQKRHRLGIALLVDPLLGLIERRYVEAALIRAISNVGFAGARGCNRRRFLALRGRRLHERVGRNERRRNCCGRE